MRANLGKSTNNFCNTIYQPDLRGVYRGVLLTTWCPGSCSRSTRTCRCSAPGPGTSPWSPSSVCGLGHNNTFQLSSSQTPSPHLSPGNPSLCPGSTRPPSPAPCRSTPAPSAWPSCQPRCWWSSAYCTYLNTGKEGWIRILNDAPLDSLI